MLKYLQLFTLIALIGSGFLIKYLIGYQAVLEIQKTQLEEVIKNKEENMKLLVIQLDREAEFRQIAESALTELYKDVPDVEFKTDLPPNIQGVLDRFHSRIRTDNP